MALPKPLIFREKTDIDYYLSDNDLNNDLYEVFLQVREAEPGIGRDELKVPPLVVFNEAYYQAGKAMTDKHPEQDFYNDYLIDARSHLVGNHETELVMSVVYVIIASQKRIGLPQRRFLTCIKSKIGKCDMYFPFFEELLNKYKSEGTSFTTHFEEPEVDVEHLNKVDWFAATDGYEPKRIEHLAGLGKDTDEKSAIIGSIVSARVEELERQVSRQQSRIGALLNENEELKKHQVPECGIRVQDIIKAIRNYQSPIQFQMFNMLRSLIADADSNWTERIRVEEERLSLQDCSDKETLQKKALCLGVATDLALIILKKANIAGYADNTKMATLISMLTDYSKDKIRQRLSDTSPLPKRHQQEVDAANRILESLGIEDRLSVNIR